MIDLALIFALVSLVIGSLAMVVALLSYIEIKAMQKSTHQIQYVYPDQQEGGFESLDKKTREKLEDESDLFDDETNFEEMP